MGRQSGRDEKEPNLKFLVDTSVWIDFFNGNQTKSVTVLKNLLNNEEDICIADIVLTETLQGFRSDTDYAKAKKHLLVFPVYSLKGRDSYIAASQIYRLCRKSGLTIRKTVDCLIARIALENDLILLHNDKDFDMIAKVTSLKILQI